jgi:hypothetical protein
MAGALSAGDRTVARDALWSAAVRATGLSHSSLPAHMRPRPVGDAMEVLSAFDDDWAKHRNFSVLCMALQHASQPAEALADGPPGECRPLPLTRDVVHPAFARGFGTAGGAATLCEQIQCEIEDQGTPEPCSIPSGVPEPAVAVFSGGKKETAIVSRYVANRSIGELADLLDPREWSKSGDLFHETYRVRDAGRRDYQPWFGPETVGESWSGLLYEHAAAGIYDMEQVLWIDFRVHRRGPLDRRERRSVAKIEAAYSLFDSLATNVGLFRLPGLIQQNSGLFSAKPRSDKRTDIEVTKRVHYGRISGWSGAGIWDYGEIFNYLAPAVLTLWTHHLQAVVPCRH